MTALMIASQRGHMPTLETLIKAKNLNLNAQNGIGFTALIMAIQNGNTSTVEILIKAGAKLDVKEDGGYTALDLAKDKLKKEHPIIKALEKAM